MTSLITNIILIATFSLSPDECPAFLPQAPSPKRSPTSYYPATFSRGFGIQMELPHVLFIAIECFTIFLPSVYGYWGLTEPSKKQQAKSLVRTKFDGRLFILIFGLALIIYKCCSFLL